MSQTPGALGRRYLPFLALAAVQVLLVAIAPSKVPGQSATGLTTGNGQTAVAGQVLDQNGQVVPGATQQADGSYVDANGNVVSANGTPIVNGTKAAVADMSKCDKNGRQLGPPGYSALMPPCVPVWHGGDNSTNMDGVFKDHINYIVYVAQGNAEVNAILATQGLAASAQQACEAKAAFHKEINKYWEKYGRTFVALDGPGANKGSTQPNQGSCNYPYFQGQCSLTPPDPPCTQAEAKVIASLHPAFVLGASATLSEILAGYHIISLGGGSAPNEYYQERTPYYYGLLMDGYRQADFDAEYWCKRMNAKPAIHAGSDVKATRNWGATPGATPVRKLAAIFPETNGDPTTFLSVKRFKEEVTGGQCNTPGGVLMIPYQSDINTAQQQSQTTVQQLIDNHITTVACFCDPIAPVFLTQNMSKQGYFPEHWITGVGLIDYDVLGRLYDPSEWAHAFGVSDLVTGQPFADTAAARWWTDAGNTGQPDATENAVQPYYSFMATAFQVAGPHPTADVIHKALVNLAPLGGWQNVHDQHTYKLGFKTPSEWTITEDTREVNWSQTRVSEIDNKPGSYCPIDGGHRFDLGEWLKGDPNVFNSQNGC